MDFIRAKRASIHQPLDDERPAKRISTPAGQRLSVILDAKRSKSPAARAKINVTTTSTYCNDPSHLHVGPVQHAHKSEKKPGFVSVMTGGRLGDTPRESSEDMRNGSNLSVSVWSKDEEKFGHIRQKSHRGFGAWGWKRIVIIAAVLIALIIALAVGLAVGTKKKNTTSTSATSSSPTTTTTATTGGAQPAGGDTNSDPSAVNEAPPQPTSTLTPSAVPANFPVGSHSLVLFLDTVNTGCTADPDTWTCAPNTDYYKDPQKALTILNWKISGTSGSYKISSGGQDATFGTTFQNEDLKLMDAGKSSERYYFQFNRAKTVNMTGTIGDEKGDFECDYGVSTMQGVLYTKMQRTYPDETIAVSDTGNPVWPFAARVEQAVAGGKGVPSCKTSSGEDVTGGLEAQDASTLCSCLYKNWTPPRVTG
ncbi:hypothetical protein EJ02DRAFT_462101 [Clathrospora elynae]|uniref:Tat pathway signal sequence n=1 Tax=Clathrospora elynae TaxID=706981 RepID=A0A6A5T2H0_9PLEO|nr:hypothetical protein EJ02DRAFT_462101 [Clathrospora elynae]